MKSNRVPFHVKIIGHDPERRCASLVARRAGPAGCRGSFWMSPLGQVMRTVSTCRVSRSPNASGTP